MLDLEEGGIPPPPYRTPKIPTLIKVKVKNGISLEIMRESFVIKQDETYNLKSGNHLAQRNIQITQYGTESVLNFRAKLWNLLTRKIKKISFLTFFKNKIRKWIPEKCPCKLCQTYIKNVAFNIVSITLSVEDGLKEIEASLSNVSMIGATKVWNSLRYLTESTENLSNFKILMKN